MSKFSMIYINVYFTEMYYFIHYKAMHFFYRNKSRILGTNFIK